MGTTEAYEGLRDRDYFHIMLNLDSHEGFLPTARALAEKFLAAARERQDDPGLEPELRFFPYGKAAFEARLDQIYEGLVDDVQRYEAQRSWTLRTRDDVIEWMRQMAPFNQTDGAWLRNIAPVGPMGEVHGLLFKIWIEELGAGDPELNHANIYTELLRSVDIDLPDIRSREYADNPDLLDAAFTLPLFQLVVAQFSQSYFPEILGMTQYLEWSSVELRNMVRLNEHFGLDPHFYEMHVAIDNAASGHGAQARRAIELHLEQIRVEVGEAAMQAEWERVWNGYVAFATTGSLGEEMRRRRARPSAPADKVAAMVRDRAPKARLNHGSKRLAGTPINDLFADPAQLMSSLVAGGMIVPGDPDASPFFDLLTPDGPMFMIFTDEEIDVWRDWVRALPAAAVEGLQVPPTPSAVVLEGTPSADRMVRLVETMRPRQEGVSAHAGIELTGPDPADPGRTVTKPVAWWFGQPVPAFLRALASADSGWIVPGDAQASRLVTEILNDRNAMARALSAEAPGLDGRTWATVVTEWIDEGCPLPAVEPVRPLTLLTPPERVAAHPTGHIHGSGSVH